MALRAMIFDAGGVLVRTIDQAPRRKWEQALGMAPGEAERIVFGAETGYAVQLGLVSEAAHWRWVQERLGLADAALADFRRDFFSQDRVDAGLLAYLARLRGRFHLGLLSNASADARRQFSEDHHLAGYFDSLTISGEEGVMKPDARIFEIALARAGALPAEAVFVDDTPVNVEAAARLGLHAIRFVDPASAQAELSALSGVK